MKKTNIVITILLIICLSFSTIGFAILNRVLEINGNVTLKHNGEVLINSIQLIDSSNLINSSDPTVDGIDVDFDMQFGGNEDEFFALYQVELYNGSFYDFTYTGFNFNPVVTSSTPGASGELSAIVDGIEVGDIIEYDETVNFTVKILLTSSNPNANYSANAESGVTGETSVEGNIRGAINDPLVGNLRGSNNLASFSIDVINTYTYQREFTLSSSNEHFEVVGSSGSPISYTIDANTTDTFTFYVKKVPGSSYFFDNEDASIKLSTNGVATKKVGVINLLVDINDVKDTTPPSVGGATLVMNVADGSATASWNRIDTGGSAIVDYTIILYNTTAGTSTEYHTNSDSTVYDFSSLSAGTYYFVVYGKDAKDNTGASAVSSATTSNGLATKSSNVVMKWKYSVSHTGNYVSITNPNKMPTTVYRGESITINFSANNDYTLPSSITINITEPGKNKTSLSSNSYTYTRANNNTTATLVLNNVKGDIEIELSGTSNGGGTCLTEGTKITLANGKTKNIEDVRYDDLLLVYNHELGGFTYEYPIWIEQEHTSNSYQVTRFSDGTTLKTVGTHAIFSIDKNEYIDISNIDNLIGQNIIKVKKQNNEYITYPVKVVDAKIINKNTKYYHIVTTRYYNLVSDDILTSDGRINLVNYYLFDDDLKWGYERQQYALSHNLYTPYSKITYMPHYMYKGFRGEVQGVMDYYGYTTVEQYKYVLFELLMNKNMILEIERSINNKRLFMVTTSDDIVNEFNKNNYKYEEGSTYLVRYPKNRKNFKYYYNSSTNEYLYPNDKIIVDMPTHLIAIYE